MAKKIMVCGVFGTILEICSLCFYFATGAMGCACNEPIQATGVTVALRDAGRNNERTYPELLRDRRCRLVVFGIEVGGRWSDEAATFLRLLAHTKARQTPALLRHSLTNAPIHRWSAMLTHAAMHAFAASFLDQDLSGCHNREGNKPRRQNLFHQCDPR